MAEPETPTTQGPSPQPGQLKELAVALCAFQKKHCIAKRTGKAQGRKYSDLPDILDCVQQGTEFGLCHSEVWRPLDTTHSVLRVTLHHVSGESIFSEFTVDIQQKNRSGSKEQAQGSAMTYARRYCLMGLYGIFGADKYHSDDDGESTTSNGASADLDQAAADLAASMDITPAPAAKEASGDELTSEEVDECKRIIKSSPDIKAAFKAEFFKEAPKLLLTMLKHKTHLDFLKQQEAYEKELKKAVQADVDKVLNP